MPLAIVEDVFVGPVGEVVFVLHADDVDDRARLGDLLDRHVGQSDVPDLALVAELPQRADRLRERHLRVDPVQLQQVDVVHPQPAQAQLGLLA